MSNYSEMSPDTAEFAFVIPIEKFIYKRRGAWNFGEPVGKDGIRNHLIVLGYDAQQAKQIIQSGDYLKVYGSDMVPNRPAIYADPVDNKVYINTWVPPTLKPIAGAYPRIQRVIDWLTKSDAEGARWLKHWMAWKVQNPCLVPKVAVVMSTQQGGGKGTLAFAMRQMLGQENTAVVKREELGNKFNARWVDRLFVLGDEVLSNDNLKDVSNMLKVLIDGNEIEKEGKNKDQKAIKSKLAWMFASNDKVAPLVLEKGDRRYTVFTNHDPLPLDYVQMLNTSFKADRQTPTDEFAAELAAFYHDLLQIQVDTAFVSRPYENAARAALIETNLSSHDLFFQHVVDNGIRSLLKEMEDGGDWTLKDSRAEWDYTKDRTDASVIAVNTVYRAYQFFCKQTGGKPLKLNRFGGAVKNQPDPWDFDRQYSPKLKRKVGVYVIPEPQPEDDAQAA